uniref:Uncharacterized protein n=1 Tax=Cucumis melo TaxID=3656 RepID=A0A9I9EC44_CUCME
MKSVKRNVPYARFSTFKASARNLSTSLARAIRFISVAFICSTCSMFLPFSCSNVALRTGPKISLKNSQSNNLLAVKEWVSRHKRVQDDINIVGMSSRPSKSLQNVVPKLQSKRTMNKKMSRRLNTSKTHKTPRWRKRRRRHTTPEMTSNVNGIMAKVPKVNYWGGRAKPLKYNIGHPILTNAEQRQPVLLWFLTESFVQSKSQSLLHSVAWNEWPTKMGARISKMLLGKIKDQLKASTAVAQYLEAGHQWQKDVQDASNQQNT